ncbi:MAG: sulfatase-like hydrolase/transferase, partial [Bacteroidales bacterium]|nr:sulfatase-like hydrolase/transferase [Bacteroidales bacterium]
MNKFTIFKTNKIFSYVLAKYILAFVLLLVTQLVFFVANNNLFSPTNFGGVMKILWGNVVFGLSATAMVLTPYLILNVIPTSLRWNKIYKGIAEVFYIIPVFIMLIANMIDAAYYPFTFRRMTSEIFGYLGVGGDMGNLIPQFLKDFWVFLVLFVVIIFVLIWCNRRIVLEKRMPHPYGTTLFKDSILSIVALAIAVLIIRGGFIYKPLRPIDASKYASCDNTSLVLNTPFSIIRTFGKSSGIEPKQYYKSEQAMEKVFTPVNTPMAALPADTLAVADSTIVNGKKNVVIIILESFSEEYVGFLNPDNKGFTPFLDSLSQHCTVYQGMSNGKRSIEAIPAILAGMPSIMFEPFITSPYATNKIEGLPEVLKRHGYHTSFFHGAYNGSMNFDAFVQSVGVDHYYGKNEFNAECGDKGYDGNWGIFDEPFLQFMAKKISTFQQPFFTSVFTISSHHPYTMPEEHVGEFPEGKHPILQVVAYSDYALRQFFATASQTEWYNNTVFVITADHTAPPISSKYSTGYNVYKVPMLVFDPANDTHIVKNRILQQADIKPTLIDYLGINEKTFSFGKSVLNPANPEYHISYGSSAYQLIKDKYYIRYDGTKLEVFDRIADP